jgi:hypothetical protein
MIVPAVEFDSIQGPGTNVMIFEIFSPKNSAKKSSGFAQNTASFCKNFDHNIGFLRKTQFFAENCRKSPKIVIITSTPVFTSWTQG